MTSLPVLSPAAPGVRAARAATGLLGFVAILVQLHVALNAHPQRVLNFFSFFTIESNLFVASIFLLGAWRPAESPRRSALRGAAALYLTITGLVYFTLLQAVDAQLGLTKPWVNVVLHALIPVLVIADWLCVPPAHEIQRPRWLPWLLFPTAYFLYSMVRGAIDDWYPYPFLNPGMQHGYSGVLLICLFLGVVIAGLAAAVARIGNARSRRGAPAL